MATVLTDLGEAWVVDMLDISASDEAEWIAWGTGAGTADKADTSLFVEASEARVQGVGSQPVADKLRYVGTLVADGSKTITNAGTFTLVTGGVLIVKGDFTGIPLNLNDEIEFTVDLEIT